MQQIDVVIQVKPFHTEAMGTFLCSYTEKFPLRSLSGGLAIVEKDSAYAIVHVSGMLFFDRMTETEAYGKRRRLLHRHEDWTDCAGFDGLHQEFCVTQKCGHILFSEGMTAWL